MEVSLQALVKQHASLLEYDAAANRVRCVMTGHSMPAVLGTVEQYVKCVAAFNRVQAHRVSHTVPFDTKRVKLTSPRHRLCCATRRGKKFAALCKKAEEMKALKQVRPGGGGYWVHVCIPAL
jgi:hypothetical protein